MIRPIDGKKIDWKAIRFLLLGILIGTIWTGLTLDGRYLAMIKAFQNPKAVNSAVFAEEIK